MFDCLRYILTFVSTTDFIEFLNFVHVKTLYFNHLCKKTANYFTMIRQILIFLFTFANVHLSAQQLNTPKEFADIMKYSKVKYIVDSNALLYKCSVTAVFPFQVSVHSIGDSRRIERIVERGNQYYQKKKWRKALKWYQKALKMDKGSVWILRRIGMVYNQQNKLNEAIDIFNSLLIHNNLDADTWSEIAMSYAMMSDTSEAFKAITKAHLFNRYDVTIERKLIEICNIFGYKFNKNKGFVAHYRLEKMENDTVTISTCLKPWRAYANCKAVWKYDDNYQKVKANDFPKNLDFVQEKECLLNFLISYGNATEIEQQKLKVEYDLLTKVIDSKRLNTFIKYEIWAAENIAIAHGFSEEEIEAIIDYILSFRCSVSE